MRIRVGLRGNLRAKLLPQRIAWLAQRSMSLTDDKRTRGIDTQAMRSGASRTMPIATAWYAPTRKFFYDTPEKRERKTDGNTEPLMRRRLVAAIEGLYRSCSSPPRILVPGDGGMRLLERGTVGTHPTRLVASADINRMADALLFLREAAR